MDRVGSPAEEAVKAVGREGQAQVCSPPEDQDSEEERREHSSKSAATTAATTTTTTATTLRKSAATTAATTTTTTKRACNTARVSQAKEGETKQTHREHNWQVQKVSLGPSSASTKVLSGGQDTKERSTKSELSRRSWRAEEPQLIPDEWFKHGARNDLTWLKPSVGCGGNHFDGSGSRLPLVADRTVEVGLLQPSVLCITSRRERSWRSA